MNCRYSLRSDSVDVGTDSDDDESEDDEVVADEALSVTEQEERLPY
jgi:hypothetical protein